MGSNADRRTDLSPAASRVPQSPLSAAPVAASLISAAQEAPLLPGMVSYSFSAHTLALRELCGDTAAVLGCDEHSLFRGDALLLEHVVSSSLFEATEVLESLLADTDARVYSYPWRRADSGEILYISNHVVAEGEGASRTISGVLLHETTREHRLSNRARILHNDLRPSAPNSPRGDELLYRAHLPLAWKLPEDADLKLHLRGDFRALQRNSGEAIVRAYRELYRELGPFLGIAESAKAELSCSPHLLTSSLQLSFFDPFRPDDAEHLFARHSLSSLHHRIQQLRPFRQNGGRQNRGQQNGGNPPIGALPEAHGRFQVEVSPTRLSFTFRFGVICV